MVSVSWKDIWTSLRNVLHDWTFVSNHFFHGSFTESWDVRRIWIIFFQIFISTSEHMDRKRYPMKFCSKYVLNGPETERKKFQFLITFNPLVLKSYEKFFSWYLPQDLDALGYQLVTSMVRNNELWSPSMDRFLSRFLNFPRYLVVQHWHNSISNTQNFKDLDIYS